MIKNYFETSTNVIKHYLKVCPNVLCTIYKSKSGDKFIFQIDHKDFEWNYIHDFDHIIDQTKVNTLKNNRLFQLAKAGNISKDEIEEFIDCYSK